MLAVCYLCNLSVWLKFAGNPSHPVSRPKVSLSPESGKQITRENTYMQPFTYDKPRILNSDCSLIRGFYITVEKVNDSQAPVR